MNQQMTPGDQLRAAAALVQRALNQLDMTSAPCTCCTASLFRNRDHARVHQQLEQLPEKLEAAANRLQHAEVGGEPRQSDEGFVAARGAFLAGASPMPYGRR